MKELLVQLLNLFKLHRLQNKFVNSYLIPKVKPYLLNKEFTKSDKYKMFYYYGVGSVLLVGESISLFRQKKLALKERKALTLMAALTGIVDDFFDQDEIKEEDLYGLMNFKSNFIPKNQKQILARDLYLELSQLINSKNLREVIQNVFLTQKNSLHQKSNQLSIDEIQLICDEKGSAAMLFYRAALNHKFLHNEQVILKKTGEIYQYCNDVFDLYKDIKSGVNTPVTLAHKIENIEEILHQKSNDLKLLLIDSRLDIKAIKGYLNLFHISVARTQVCIKQLKEVQARKIGRLDFKKWARNELVCDMEKPKNTIEFIKTYKSLLSIDNRDL